MILAVIWCLFRSSCSKDVAFFCGFSLIWCLLRWSRERRLVLVCGVSAMGTLLWNFFHLVPASLESLAATGIIRWVHLHLVPVSLQETLPGVSASILSGLLSWPPEFRLSTFVSPCSVSMFEKNIFE